MSEPTVPTLKRVIEKRPKHRPGAVSIAVDGFVKVVQKPIKRPQILPVDVPHLANPADRISFDEDELATMPLQVRRTVLGKRVRVWTDREGRWWRTAGMLRIRLCEDGVRRFVIALYKGANTDDLDDLLEWVEKARAGRVLSTHWRPCTADWADSKTFTMSFNARAYSDPFRHADKAPIVFPCTEDRCTAKWHRASETHTLDVIEKKSSKLLIDYRIHVEKDLFPDPADPVQGWYVRHDVEDFAGRVSDVAELISDLEWAREECRRANQPPVRDMTAGQILAHADALGVLPSALLAEAGVTA